MRNLLWLLILLTLTACNMPVIFASATTPVQADEPATYLVQPNDTLSQIAARHHTTVEQIIALNVEQYPQLARDSSRIQPGWRLRVPAPKAEPAEQPGNLDQSVELVLEEINAARAQRGLAELRADATLTRMANDRCTDMVARNYFSHYDPQTGQQPLMRYLQATQYPYRTAGENIAEVKNQSFWVPPWFTVVARYSPQELAHQFVVGWLNSPDHRANILNGRYRRTGIALAASGDARRVVATQLFSD